jgi:serine/threonine protein kinase
MLVMNYASGGDLHHYLRKNFTNITWDKKLYILWQIIGGYLSYFYYYHLSIFQDQNYDNASQSLKR